MNILQWLILFLISLLVTVEARGDQVLLVVGEPGEASYQAVFTESARAWRAHFDSDELFSFYCIGDTANNTEQSDRNALKNYLEQADPQSKETLWIILHGHGTFDEKITSFNLRGKDVTLNEFHQWLKPLAKRPTVFINSSASSSQYLTKLASPNRILITATQTTGEENYTYFGQYLSAALKAKEADLDGDESLSLLEVFLHASRSVEAHYKNENRLATEHALIDDNSDGKGTPVDFFRGLYAVAKPKSASKVDGIKAASLMLSMSEQERQWTDEERLQRSQLEREIGNLRLQRKKMGDQAYYIELEKIALQLAEMYHEEESQEGDTQ